MPDFDFQYPGAGGGQYSYSVPSFSQIFGQSPNDLLGFLSGLRNESQRQKYGFESDMQGRQLGEAGRQFDVSNQFAGTQERNRNRHLDDLLNFQKDQERNRISEAGWARAQPGLDAMIAEQKSRWSKPQNTYFTPVTPGYNRI